MHQTERQGRTSCKLSYWRYFQCLFSCSSLDAHFGETYFPLRDTDLRQRNFVSQKLGRTPVSQHLLFDACFTELFSGVSEGPGSQSLSKQALENTWCNGLSCENSYLNAELLWEISHNLFSWPFDLKSCQIWTRKRGRTPEETFQKDERRNHRFHPKKSRFHTDSLCGAKPSQMFDTFLHTKTTEGCDHNPVTSRNKISQDCG